MPYARAILLASTFLSVAATAAEPVTLNPDVETKSLGILREGLAAEDFWPAMHAAEGLTLAGHGAEVVTALTPRLDTERDGQRRCGLARELVRAGDRARAAILLALLGAADPHAHIHAAESLFKVNQIGDGDLLRAAMADRANPTKAMMAAAALARWGNGEAMAYLREQLDAEDPEVSKIAAWVIGQVGGAGDIAALKAGAAEVADPAARSFFEHALANLGDAEGIARLTANLSAEDDGIRTMAANFAGEGGLASTRDGLIALLDDKNLDTRIRAAQSLMMLARPVAKPEGIVANDPFPATTENPRYSEGDITVLNDGRYLFATTEFMDTTSDFAKARLVGRISSDGGQTWGDPSVIQENVGGLNVMSLSFQPLNDSELGLFYLIKNTTSELNVFLRRSADAGLTFGEAIQVTSLPGYHVLNNDRIIRLKNGRLLVPTASSADVEKENHFICRAWISDDAGHSWRPGSGTVDYAKRGAMEPELLEMKDGRVLMIIRTQLGHIAASWSEDGGDTWTEAKDWGVRAPEAPSTIRRVPSTGDLMLIWNDTFVEGAGHGGKRTPLTVAISRDEGKTWEHKKNLEESPDHTYAYISATFDDGRALLGYYVSDEATGWISSRFRSVPIAWLYE